MRRGAVVLTLVLARNRIVAEPGCGSASAHRDRRNRQDLLHQRVLSFRGKHRQRS